MKIQAVFCLLFALYAGRVEAADLPALNTPMDKVNYAIGVDIARNFRRQGVDLNLDLVMRGLRDGMAGDKLLIPEKELRKILLTFQNELREKQAAARRAA